MTTRTTTSDQQRNAAAPRSRSHTSVHAQRRDSHVFNSQPNGPIASDPASGVEQREAVEAAVLVLFERRSPTERATYVLGEAFDYPYDDIAARVKNDGGSNSATGQPRPKTPGFRAAASCERAGVYTHVCGLDCRGTDRPSRCARGGSHDRGHHVERQGSHDSDLSGAAQQRAVPAAHFARRGVGRAQV
jgi:hypothetical protein